MEKRIKQSSYYNLLRVFAALLLGIFVYFAAIVIYYGNPAKVVKAEVIGGLMFSFSFALLCFCLLSSNFFDKKYYIGDGTIRVSHLRNTKSAELKNAIRTDLSVTPMMRLFKSARLKIYFSDGTRITLYVGKEDADYMLSLITVRGEKKIIDKICKKDIFKSCLISLLYAAAVVTVLGAFLFPLFFYQVYDAGIKVNISFAGGSFFGKAALLSLIIYACILAAEIVLAVVIMLIKFLLCFGSSIYFDGAYCGIFKEGLFFYDKRILRKNLKGVYSKETPVSRLFKMKCAGGSFDVGKQAARLSFFKCAVSFERANSVIQEMIGGMPEAEPYKFKQCLPLMTIYGILFGLPIIMYAIISGPAVLISLPVVAIFFAVQSRNRTFAASNKKAVVSGGIWVKRTYFIFLDKATVSKVKEGPFVKLFDMKNAQVYMGEGGDIAYFPALNEDQLAGLQAEFLSDKKTVDI